MKWRAIFFFAPIFIDLFRKKKGVCDANNGATSAEERSMAAGEEEETVRALLAAVR